MSMSRRALLRTSAASGAGVLATSLLAPPALAAPAAASPLRAADPARGQLFPPLESRNGDLLALPRGFSYRAVAVSGQTEVHDGKGKAVGVTPERPDGTLAVAADRGYRLIQNHEASPGSAQPVPFVEGTVYDRGALGGGCTVIETNRGGARRSEWVGLSGTIGNCAGGPTPWGSWLTCEENDAKAGTGTLEKDHGYVFEVFADAPSAQIPKPIKAWGRAPHEAVVIEPDRRTVYLTEDASRPTGLVYRWSAPTGFQLRPHIADRLGDNDGRLDALAVIAPDGGVLPDLAYATSAQIGRPFATRWVRVPDRTARETSLRNQFAAGAVTHAKKLEGAWGDRRGMYFVSSFSFAKGDLPADATPHDGQLWYYEYTSQTLTLVAYFPYNAMLHNDATDPETGLGASRDLAFDGPDGCHVSPYGSLVLTEDGSTANHMLSWSRETGAQAIVRNLIVQEQNKQGTNVYSEMTGPCFSPDGLILFGNVQEPGHCFAITGPWRRYLA